ncbi:MAG TPA: mechanosensitive ion channel family protein [Candidatus Portnoybacteria bacterium]|nr:mechanosensitive ion channel family protein [Candidatus Portnoybacteria bacterium]
MSINLSTTIFHNTIQEYLIALAIFIISLIVLKAIRTVIFNQLDKLAKKTKTDIDDTFIKIIQSVKPPFYSFLAVYFSILTLNLTPLASKIFNAILIIWLTYQVVIAIQILINYIVKKKFPGDKKDRAMPELIGKILKGTLWTIGILLILSNLGVNISSLIAGLGIGGVAVALAAQNILSDLFSSFSIYFDKPFEIGDFIIVGTMMGTVEKIGIKTTRIRALQGEEIIFSNQQLTTSQIQNFGKMKERRVIFRLGVVYQTPTEKLKKIPHLIQEIIQAIKLTRFDRTHFVKFDNSALTFEVVYYLQTPDYNKYMDIHQAINFQIKESFEKEGIEIAYPTQTIYLNKN